MKNLLMLFALLIATVTFSQSSDIQVEQIYSNSAGPQYSVIEYHANGVVKTQGQLDEFGNKTGLWVAHWENGNLMFAGSWSMGLKHGEHVSYNSEGDPILVSSWKLDKRHGSFKRYSEEGDQLVEQREYRKGRLTESFSWNQESGGLLIVKL